MILLKKVIFEIYNMYRENSRNVVCHIMAEKGLCLKYTIHMDMITGTVLDKTVGTLPDVI